jgi:hypothetical protein
LLLRTVRYATDGWTIRTLAAAGNGVSTNVLSRTIPDLSGVRCLVNLIENNETADFEI